MPRRLKLWFDPFLALQHLRDFLATCGQRAKAATRPLAERLGRAARPLTAWLHAQSDRSTDEKVRPAKLELQPMDWRNAPSESIAQTALPLAATAAAAAAAVYFAATLEANDRAVASAAAAERLGGYDSAPASIPAVTLDPAGNGGSGSRLEEQTTPMLTAASAAAPDESNDAAASAIDGAGSTLHATQEDEFGKQDRGGAVGGGGSGSAVSPNGFDSGATGGSSNVSSALDAVGGDVGSDGFFGGAAAGNDGLSFISKPDNFQESVNAGAGATSSSSSEESDNISTSETGNVGSSIPTGSGGSTGTGQPPTSGPLSTVRQLFNTGNQPVRFVQNAGQWAEDVDFSVSGEGYQTWISRDALVVNLAQPFGESGTVEAAASNTIRLEWNGISNETTASGEERLASVSNFFLGSDPAAWRTNVPEYASVRYADAWDGIDLVYRRADGAKVEYDLVVQPGATAQEVGFTVHGADARVDEDGRLILTTASGAELIQTAPLVYQARADGGRDLVAGSYCLRSDGSIGFTVDNYDAGRQLIIDPVLIYNYTNFDSAGVAYGVTADAVGNAYIAGGALVGAGGVSAGFVSQVDPDGNLVWSSYFGGEATTWATGITLGPNGTVYVTGSTQSELIPTSSNAYIDSEERLLLGLSGFDAFLIELSNDGMDILYGTYLGGEGDDFGTSVAIDQVSGEAIVVGMTASELFPTQNAYQNALASIGYDAFVTRFTSDGEGLVFSTYLGGTGEYFPDLSFPMIYPVALFPDFSSSDVATGVALDSAGNVVVIGTTVSPDFPTLNGFDSTLDARDAFLTKFSSGGGLLESTFFGGSDEDFGFGVTVDGDDRIYVTGLTASDDLPVFNAAQEELAGGSDAFVARFISLDSAPDYMTYLGGTEGEVGYAITLDSVGRVIVVGETGSEDFPLEDNAEPTFTGPSLFVSRYVADGSILDFSTYSEYGERGYAVAVGPEGEIFAAGRSPFGNAVLLKYGPLPPPTITDFADDTGSSNSDRLTYDTTPTVSGTGYEGATIALYIEGAGDDFPTLLGTTTVSAGAWTYTLPTLTADGTYRITAKAEVSAEMSLSSAPLTFTLDTTPPSVVLSVVTQTYDRQPDITVTASDLNGISSPATVTLDADLNNDSDFLDVGETGFATALLANGAATFGTYTLLTVGTITNFRARVTDYAGNQGTSSTKSVNVLVSPSNWPTASATPSTLSGQLSLFYAGDVSTSHALDLDVSPQWCQYCQDALVYHSQEAAPAPTVQAIVQSDNTYDVPDSVVGTLTWDGAVVGTMIWDGDKLDDLSPGGAWVFGIAPTTGLTTGRHTYTLDLFFDYGGEDDFSRSVGGQTFLVNRSNSPYGAGWSFKSTDTLVEIEADGTYPPGVLRLFGSGGWAFYEEDSEEYISPPGDKGLLTFIHGVGWKYEAVDGTVSWFDLSGRMISKTSPWGDDFVEYTYSGGSGTTAKLLQVESSDAGIATFVYDGGSGLLDAIVSHGGPNEEVSRATSFFHTGTDLTQIVDADDGVHTFSYDGSHRLLAEKFGHFQRTFTYTDEGLADSYVLGDDPVVKSAWGVGLDDAGKALPDGYVPGEIIDALNYPRKIWFDDAGREMELFAPESGYQKWKRNIDGYVTNYIDALGRVTTFTVDSVGNILEDIRPDGTSATWEYNGPYHSLTGHTDYNGNLWTYTNDAYGRPISVTDPLNHTTTYSYSDGRVSTITDPLDQIVYAYYDGSKRPTETLIGGAGTGTISYDGMGNPNKYKDALGNVTTSIYDAMGRVTATIDPLGNRTTTVYDAGYVRSTTDAAGNVTSYAYNTVGQVVAMIEAYGTSLERRTTYVYDAANRLIATVDPLGHRTTNVLDSEGRVVATIDALGHQTAYQYNLVGNLTASVDALGRVTFYEYDLLGRQVSVTDALGNTTQTVYDNNSNVIAAVDALGHRATSVYDVADRLIASVDALGHRITYGYDAINRQVSVTDALGNTMTIVYDARDRVEATINALNKRTTYGYDAADNLTTITDANGNVTTNVYDKYNRQIATIDALGKRTTAVYDAAGRAEAYVDELGNRTTTVYDALNRAITTIDALGNRTTTVYDAADRVTASIDARGNRTTAVYDAANRLTATIDALGKVSVNVYDAVGNVIASVNAIGQRTTYTIDALNRVIATTDPLGAVSSVDYDDAGRLVASTDPLGNVTTYVYDNADRPIAIIDALGKRSTTVYDKAGNATEYIDALGNRSTSVYDKLNRVEATVDALNHRTTFLYDNVGNMIATVDVLGRVTTGVYDKVNRQIATIDALNHISTVVFDAGGNMIESVDALGNRSTWVYDKLNRVEASIDALGRRTTTTYDAAGNVRTTVDALNRTTTFAYDVRNMLVATTDARGNVWTTQYDALGRGWREIDPLGHDTRTYFDAAGRVIETADQLGNRARTVYDAAGNAIATVDPLGNRTTSVFDELNRVEAVVDALGRRTTAVYDAAGNMVETIDALGRTTTAVFDKLNRVEASIDALGNRSTSVYDAVGNVVASIDALGRITTAVYDKLNRVIEVEDALGHRSTSVYDKVGNQIASIDALNRIATTVFDELNRTVANVDPLGHRATSIYDAVGQVIASIDALGNRTTAVFDKVGNVIEVQDALGNVTTSVYDAANRRIAVIDALGRRVTTTYDDRGLVVAVRDAVGTFTQAVYDAAGNTLATIDGLGHRTTSVFDKLNRVEATIDALGNRTTSVYDALGRIEATIDALGFRTTNVFDKVGNRTELIDASGNHTTWTYDAARQVTSEQDVGGTATFAYDKAGRLKSATEKISTRRRDFDYDATGQKTSEVWFTSGVTIQLQAWTYDGAGRLESEQDPDGTSTYSYDHANRVTQVEGPFGLVLTYGYDKVGNRTRVEDSLGGVTTVTFDKLNRQLSEQTAGSGVSAMRFDYAYTIRGQVESVTRYSDLAGTATVVLSAYSYDDASRLRNLKHTSGSGTVLANYTYSYDAADRLTEKVENGTSTTYNYDTASQLTRDGSSTFSYDASGNRTNPGYATDPGNRISTDGVWTYTHDTEGNITKKSKGAASDTWVYTYDHRNQMLTAAFSATDGGAVTQRVTYAYDASGARISRAAWNGSTTTTERYGYDGGDPTKPAALGNENKDAWAILDGANTLVSRWVFGVGQDEVVARQTATGTVTWDLADRQGSVRLVIDNSATTLGSATFSAYGALVGGSIHDGYGYAGVRRDSITLLDSNGRGMREYDPAVGLWYQADPRWPLTGEANPYMYVRNNPTNGVDPSGMWIFASRTSQHDGVSDADLFTNWLQQKGINFHSEKVGSYAIQTNFTVYYINPFHRELFEKKVREDFGRMADNIIDKAFGDKGGKNLVIHSRLESIDYIENLEPGSTAPTSIQLNAAAKYEKYYYERLYNELKRTEYTKYLDAAAKTFPPSMSAPGMEPPPDYRRWVERALSIKLEEEAAAHASRNAAERAAREAELRRRLTAALAITEKAEFDKRWEDAQWRNWRPSAALFWFGPEGLAYACLPGSGPRQSRRLSPAQLRYLNSPTSMPHIAGPATGIKIPAEPWIPGTRPLLYQPGQGLPFELLDPPTRSLKMLQPACFVAGTRLLTPSGSKPIEEFVRGDLLLSRDEHDADGAVSFKMVEEVFVKLAKIIHVYVSGRIVGTTMEHPFWVQGKGWLPARELIAGDRFVGHDKRESVVEKIVDSDQWATVYNLRVADFHTYFVGGDEWGFSVWAHNLCEAYILFRNNEWVVFQGDVLEARIVYRTKGYQDIINYVDARYGYGRILPNWSEPLQVRYDRYVTIRALETQLSEPAISKLLGQREHLRVQISELRESLMGGGGNGSLPPDQALQAIEALLRQKSAIDRQLGLGGRNPPNH